MGLLAFGLFLEKVFYSVAQPCLKLKILLPQPAECWDYSSLHYHTRCLL